MSGEPPRKVYQGEILPPESPRGSNMPDVPPGTPLGIPLFAQMKYEGRARAFRAYIEMRSAQRALVDVEAGIAGAMEGKLAAETRLAIALQRQRHLPEVLRADEAAFLSELSDVFQAVADKKAGQEKNRRRSDMEERIEMANLEAEALEAEARLERLRNPTKPVSDPEEHLSPVQRATREIARVKKEFAELRAALIEAAGGEENLTEDDRAHLDTLDLAANNKIREIMEGM